MPLLEGHGLYGAHRCGYRSTVQLKQPVFITALLGTDKKGRVGTSRELFRLLALTPIKMLNEVGVKASMLGGIHQGVVVGKSKKYFPHPQLALGSAQAAQQGMTGIFIPIPEQKIIHIAYGSMAVTSGRDKPLEAGTIGGNPGVPPFFWDKPLPYQNINGRNLSFPRGISPLSHIAK
jgi:hypothetical protein